MRLVFRPQAQVFPVYCYILGFSPFACSCLDHSVSGLILETLCPSFSLFVLLLMSTRWPLMQKVRSRLCSLLLLYPLTPALFTGCLPSFQLSLTILFSIAHAVYYFLEDDTPFFFLLLLLLLACRYGTRTLFVSLLCFSPFRSPLLWYPRLIPFYFYYDDSIHCFILWVSPRFASFHTSL